MLYKITKLKLPAYWASALINSDSSGMEDDDIADLDKFIARHPEIGHCTGCSEESEFAPFNDAGTLAGDVLEYTFMKPIERKAGSISSLDDAGQKIATILQLEARYKYKTTERAGKIHKPTPSMPFSDGKIDGLRQALFLLGYSSKDIDYIQWNFEE